MTRIKEMRQREYEVKGMIKMKERRGIDEWGVKGERKVCLFYFYSAHSSPTVSLASPSYLNPSLAAV